MFLNGTAMSGQADHGAIAGATFLGRARTAPYYRFFTARDAFPGLFPVSTGGSSIEGELYEVSEETLYRRLMPAEPAELELGAVLLDDGQVANAMHLQPERIAPGDSITDLTELGGWRRYQAHLLAQRGIRDVLGL